MSGLSRDDYRYLASTPVYAAIERGECDDVSAAIDQAYAKADAAYEADQED